MMLDIDFVEMLEYGMPPACGMGYSERVFWIFEGVTAREGVPFPQLKSEIDKTTREIYLVEVLILEHLRFCHYNYDKNLSTIIEKSILY